MNSYPVEIKSWDYFALKKQESEKNTHVFRQRETDLFHVGADLHRSSKGENLERERDDRKHAKPAMSHKPGCFKGHNLVDAQTSRLPLTTKLALQQATRERIFQNIRWSGQIFIRVLLFAVLTGNPLPSRCRTFLL